MEGVLTVPARAVRGSRTAPHTDQKSCWRIRVICAADPRHAKIVELNELIPRMDIHLLAEILRGEPRFFVHPPGDGCPVGFCRVCGGALKTEVSFFEATRNGKKETSASPAA